MTASRREIADRLTDIARGIARLSRRRDPHATLHNVGAAARQIMDFSGRHDDIERAAQEVIKACERLNEASSWEDLSQGQMPPAADLAQKAYDRLKRLVLP